MTADLGAPPLAATTVSESSCAIHGHDGRAAFHPQRLFPRYARTFATAAVVPGGLRAASRLARPIAFDDSPSSTENPSGSDLAQAQVALCGFPRTGTTFLQEAINVALDDERACWRSHDPLSVPINIKAAIPTLITLREPLSTIVSWSLYNNDAPSQALFSARIASYLAWHREIRRRVRSPWVSVLDFSEFSSAPTAALLRFTAFSSARDLTTKDIATRVHHANDQAAIGLHMRNMPDPTRVNLSGRYVELSQSPTSRRLLGRASKIYEDLLEHAQVA